MVEATKVDVSALRARPLGRVLVKMGKVTREQVHEALAIQKTKGGPLGQILVDLGYIDEKTRTLALAYQAGMEHVELSGLEIPQEVIDLIPAQMANAYKVVPLDRDPTTNRLTVAIASADNFRATDDLRTLMGYNVTAKITDREQLDSALLKYYDVEPESIGEIINEIVGDEGLAQFQDRGESIDLDTIREMAEANPVKRLVNMVLLEAIRNRASDIHFEPFEDEFKMRYRIDGHLYEMLPPPKSIAVAIASRIKVMSNLNIAERRLPQDGRIELVVDGNPVDLRVSVLPTMFGESVVMRVLDRSNVALDLERIGLREDDLRVFRQLIARPNGIVIVTGPTGSGKTTTLYSALNELNDVDVKILTSEDPVEYDIDGLVQVQIHSDIGLTFARCLRHFLRQDPDIILVGEVRDLETAQIAVQASLTGHLVFTTLHTNDAAGAVIRMMDMGVESYLLAAAIRGVLAQRLVRRLCPSCRRATPVRDEDLALLGEPGRVLAGRPVYEAAGCPECLGGYRGRIGIFEMLVVDEAMQNAIRGGDETARRQWRAAGGAGRNSLLGDGLDKVLAGETTLAEVMYALGISGA